MFITSNVQLLASSACEPFEKIGDGTFATLNANEAADLWKKASAQFNPQDGITAGTLSGFQKMTDAMGLKLDAVEAHTLKALGSSWVRFALSYWNADMTEGLIICTELSAVSEDTYFFHNASVERQTGYKTNPSVFGSTLGVDTFQ